MGCGKSKHDVASGNTVMKSSASRKTGLVNKTENKDIENDNVDIVRLGVQVEQKENVSVVSDVEVKDDEVVNDVKGEVEKNNVQEESGIEKTNVQEEKEVEPEEGEKKIWETLVVKEQSEYEKSDGGKDDLLKGNEQKSNVNEYDNATAT